MELKSNGWVFWILPALLFLIYELLFFNQCENFHLASDEVDVILRFLNAYQLDGNLSGLWYTFNEHINLIIKTLSLIYFEISGEFNYKFIYFLSATSFSFYFYYLLKELWISKIGNWHFLISSILIFSFTQFKLTAWALVGFQYYAASLFALVCFKILERKIDLFSILLSVLLGLIATLTFGNGILTFMVIPIILWLKNYKKQALLLASIGLVAVLIYYFSFKLTLPQNEYQWSTYHMFRYYINLHSFSVLSSNGFVLLFIGLVVFIISVIPFISIIYYSKNENFVLRGLHIFFFFTLIIIALSRHSKGIEDAFQNRYNYYTIMLLALSIYLIIKDFTLNVNLQKGLVVGSFLFVLCTFILTYSNFFLWKKKSIQLLELCGQWEKNSDNKIMQVYKQSKVLGVYNCEEVLDN